MAMPALQTRARTHISSIRTHTRTRTHILTRSFHTRAIMLHTHELGPSTFTMEHTATRCNTLQHAATHPTHSGHYNAQTRTWPVELRTVTHCHILQHTATYCNTLYTLHVQAIILHKHELDSSRFTMQHTATHYNPLHHAVSRCTTLQHAAIRYNIPKTSGPSHCTNTNLAHRIN